MIIPRDFIRVTLVGRERVANTDHIMLVEKDGGRARLVLMTGEVLVVDETFEELLDAIAVARRKG